MLDSNIRYSSMITDSLSDTSRVERLIRGSALTQPGVAPRPVLKESLNSVQ